MKYKVIFTHDPQDFFNGELSAEETSEQVEFNFSTSDTMYSMADTFFGIMFHVRNGYKAIILPKEGDNSG